MRLANGDGRHEKRGWHGLRCCAQRQAATCATARVAAHTHSPYTGSSRRLRFPGELTNTGRGSINTPAVDRRAFAQAQLCRSASSAMVAFARRSSVDRRHLRIAMSMSSARSDEAGILVASGGGRTVAGEPRL
jgi:hypothetical protein